MTDLDDVKKSFPLYFFVININDMLVTALNADLHPHQTSIHHHLYNFRILDDNIDMGIGEPDKIVFFAQLFELFAKGPHPFFIQGEGVIAEKDVLHIGVLFQPTADFFHHIFDTAAPNIFTVSPLITKRAVERTPSS